MHSFPNCACVQLFLVLYGFCFLFVCPGASAGTLVKGPGSQTVALTLSYTHPLRDMGSRFCWVCGSRPLDAPTGTCGGSGYSVSSPFLVCRCDVNMRFPAGVWFCVFLFLYLLPVRLSFPPYDVSKSLSSFLLDCLFLLGLYPGPLSDSCAASVFSPPRAFHFHSLTGVF